MVSAKAARNVVGIIGNVISFGLFLSPTPTFYRIVKKKSVEEFVPLPYIATVLNCMCWIYYGMPFVNPDSLLVVTINGVGLFLELVYLGLYFYYAPANGRKQVGYGVSGEIVFMVVLVVATMLGTSKLTKRSLAVGIICDFFNVLMYFAPLSIMRKVIRTKSVEYMPFYLSLTNFLNGCCWTAYALLYKFDPFILVSNGLGAISGTVQLILYAWYYKSTPKKSDEPAGKTIEV